MIDAAVSQIPFSPALIGDDEIAAVTEVLKSGWITMGPKTKAFEAAIAGYVQARHGIALNSCTAALHLAHLASDIGPGDEVVTTPLTFCASLNTIMHAGAKPVLADVDPFSLNLSAEGVEKVLTPRTKGVVPVHYAGNPVDMDPLMELARDKGLVVTDDAAHALGTFYKGRPVGSLADYTAFSFYATKNLATGEGGMLTTNHDEAADQIRVLGLHGMSRNAWKRYTGAGSWFYEVEEAGFKYNMADLAAALGLAQFARFEAMQATRKAYVARYFEAFKDHPALELPPLADEARGDVHAWHLFVLRLRPEALKIDRDAFIEELKAVGVQTSVHFIPASYHPIYQRTLGVKVGDFPVAEDSYRRMVSLPLSPALKPEQIEAVCERVLAIADRHRR
ncbi:DegT/DnrJ/EryC1/StrS family aminotransferase [bacterium]|nr:DegT/DnrJ/EryC1/StrS family aminotransferase [bacterium]